MKNLSCYRALKVIIDVNAKNRNKSAILHFCSAIIEVVRELLISNRQNKFKQDT